MSTNRRMFAWAVEAIAPPRCAACDTKLRRDAAFCGACVETLLPPPALPPGTTAAFAYGGALADAIRSVKYGGRCDRLRALERAIVQRLPPSRLVDVVVPVPLHRARLRARGFDQSALLARSVARALGRPLLVEGLARIVDTPRVAALSAEERATAVRHAFVARALRGASVLLVDDVRTTGATLDAACRAVRDVGATPRCHVLAATPKG